MGGRESGAERPARLEIPEAVDRVVMPMPSTSEAAVSFDRPDDRSDRMHATIEAWIEDLVDLVDAAAASDEFQEWLDVHSRFHEYSYRNTLLIKQQRPDATYVAGFRTWQEAFDRHVLEGERAIWIWAPLIAKRCPDCGNSPTYHDRIDCEYNETPTDEWSKGVVGFKPAPVFDVSQTEGAALPALNTETRGDASDIVTALIDAADALDLEARIVPPGSWEHGGAKGVCSLPASSEGKPRVEAKARSNEADLVTTLLHEYAHARLHSDGREATSRPSREVEAEAVAYVVGRHLGLDTSNSAFYLAAWRRDDPEALRDRLHRISSVAGELIESVAETM